MNAPSSIPRLCWTLDGRCVFLECFHGDIAIPTDSWASEHPITGRDGQKAKLGPLLTLIDDAKVNIVSPTCIALPHSILAGLNSEELRGLGLPEPMNYTLEIEGTDGLIVDPGFQFKYRFIHPSGRPVMGYERVGAILTIADQKKTILDPLFSAIEAMDRHNASNFEDRTTRMESIAIVQEILPNDAFLSNSLKSIRMVRADCVSIRPFINHMGEADFDPLLMREVGETSMTLDPDTPRSNSILPDAVQDSYANIFRRQNNIFRTQAAGMGYYVVVPEPLRKVLELIKRKQGAPDSERRKFISNPHPYIKELLENEVNEDIIDQIFVESDDYSSRVRDIGVYVPRVLPFIRQAKEPWLPPEEIGLHIGDQKIALAKEEIKPLIQEVECALAKHELSIKYKDVDIPVTAETLTALNDLIGTIGDQDSQTIQKKVAGERIALLIHDNLETVNFTVEVRPGKGDIGIIPACLLTELLPHQKTGYEWLQELWVAGSRGGILADDMGLGKTLQALTFLAWVREQEIKFKKRPGPILIVAPTGLLKNWLTEHNKHLATTGLGELLEAQGAKLQSIRLSQALSGNEAAGLPVLDIERLKSVDWVMTSYETMRDYQHSFGRVHWLVIVFDEAQKIKNPSTIVTDAAKAMNSDFVIALTGTPVENRIADLWSISDAVRPGTLGSLKDFVKEYENLDDTDSQRLSQLHSLITKELRPPLVKRRLKKDHLEGLPSIEYFRQRKLMPPIQAEAYVAAVNRARTGVGYGGILQAIQAFRSISLCPGEVGNNDEDFINSSARLQFTFEILDRIRQKREKALIFLDSLSVQGRIAEVIQRRYDFSSPPLIINGDVPGYQRMQKVDQFQSRHGFDVMILSPRAGGIGFNLTEANHVIHVARWWNPAVEDQCTDRVYRIGQNRKVHVHIPLAVHPIYGDHSFDIRLDSLLSEKRALSHAVLLPPAATDMDIARIYDEVVGVKTN